MPLPFMDVLRQNLWLDVGVGAALGLGGWYLQGRFTDSRRQRRQARLTTDLGRPERRRTLRATESAGRSDKEQAAALAAAIDALVEFVDGVPTRARAAECAAEVERLVPAGQRGTMTEQFLRLQGTGAPPARVQRTAEEVCVQMAVELRAIVARIQAAPTKPARASPRPATPPPPPAPARAAPASAAARPAWEVEEERIFAAGRAARKPVAKQPAARKPVAKKGAAKKPTRRR